ncbi:Cellobiohydrolase I [Mycena venus]|uniref:Cellobiohydrolase I n=1 Tax=Mycena venus TaxID=2733690 RepID=A0A8H6XV43_9AGAR|nr:Cellobiohydrolase I [Mycena venus]
MAAVIQEPSGLDEDPAAYLALPRFNHTLDFDFELSGADSHTATVSYAATDVPPDASWPVLVFFNGLGGHRLIAAMTEGIAREHSVQILTLDKPGAGSSSRGVSIPLAARTRWMHAALMAVLAHEHITRFAVLSHSNGIFYALYTLLHLPPTLTATNWTLSGPFMPQTISGSLSLRLAAALPTPLPNALGSLLQVVPPVARVVGWSSGLLSMSAGMLSTPKTADETPEESERRKPPHQRGYMHRYVGSACRTAIMRRGMGESRLSMGQEALFCLHGGDTVPGAGGESDSVWGLGAGATDADVLRGAFTRIAELYPDDALRIHVVYGADDGLVPAKGRAWLKDMLESAGLMHDEDAWTEVPQAGHDDILFLEEVVGKILRRVE